MQRSRVASVSRARLGDEQTEILTDTVFTAPPDSIDQLLMTAESQFHHRLVIELAALRADLMRELATTRLEVLRWLLLLWILQVGAFAGIVWF